MPDRDGSDEDGDDVRDEPSPPRDGGDESGDGAASDGEEPPPPEDGDASADGAAGEDGDGEDADGPPEEELEKRPPQDLLGAEPSGEWATIDGDGEDADDESLDGESPDGESSDGGPTDGESPDGDPTDDGSADDGDEDDEIDPAQERLNQTRAKAKNRQAAAPGPPPDWDPEEDADADADSGAADADGDEDDADDAGAGGRTSRPATAPPPQSERNRSSRGSTRTDGDSGDEGDVASAASSAVSGVSDALSGGIGGETAPDDEEMPLTDHVEEMALRALAVLLVIVGVGGVTVIYADDMINFLWYSFIGPGLDVCPGEDCPRYARPRVYHPLALVLARLKMASLVGVIVALPVAVYQTYRFMRPGLYPRERRYYLAAVPTSLVLATIGVAFAHLAVLPALFEYFSSYSERAAELAFGLSETFNLIVLMLGFFALVFQIPLLVMLAIMMGVTTRQWLADRRLYFWGGFAAVSFLFGPDPTGMAPLIMTATMIVLFDGTLLLLRWTGEGSFVPSSEAAAARRPYAWAVAALAAYVASPAPIPAGYYESIPPVVVQFVADQGWTAFTPILIAGSLIAVYELGAYLLRRFGHSQNALRLRLAVADTRIPVWLVFVVVGYWGSPDPLFIRLARQLSLRPAYAAGVAVALAVGYELVILGLRLRERRAAD